MKLAPILSLCVTLAFAGCAQIATVKEIKPKRSGSEAKAGDPIAALSDSIKMAESAWRRLESNPADVTARQDYNFAVSRICGTLRKSKLAPWKTPIQAGGHTLTWKRDTRPEWNPALYEIIPADQLKISGTYVDERETKEGLGAPVVARRLADPAHEYAPTPHFF